MSQAAKDFSGQNLRGKSFRGQDLTGANFSNADIRGANFSEAVLREASFRGVKAGSRQSGTTILLLTGGLLTLFSGFILASLGGFAGYLINPDILYSYTLAPSIVFIVVFVLFSTLIIYRNFKAILIFAFFAFLASGTLIGLNYIIRMFFNQSKTTSILLNISIVSPLLILVAVILLGIGVSIIAIILEDYVLSIITGFILSILGAFGFDLVYVSSSRADIKIMNPFFKALRHIIDSLGEFNSMTVSTLITALTIVLGVYLSKIVILKDKEWIWVWNVAVSLQGANLSKVKLKQAQLDGANLSGAILTGAFIEDWGITAETKLDNIRCEYIYMRVPTEDNPDPIRKPDNYNEVFKDGDFADFIRPLTDTLDLYHNQGVDPRAIAIAFKDLAENHPDAELEIVAMEKRGRDKFLLRAKTASVADKSELSAEYFSTYNQIKALSEVEVKVLLREKDRRIQSLEAMVVTALQSPSFYTETNIKQVGSMTNNPGGINQSVSGGQVYGGMQAAIGSNNTQSQEIHSKASSEKGLTQDQVIELFAQLESVIRQPELPGEVQTKAVKYLDAAKAEVQEKEPDKQLAAGNLKRMAETIESTSKTMESGKKIWETTKPVLEALLPWLGVAKSFFGF